jgi:coenzyme Q-binding protein COQ10
MPTHAEQRVLPYSQEELYKLVADVESYPDFLPWCVACRVTSRKDDIILADLVIGYKMVREKFSSRVTLDPYNKVHVEYLSGPMKYLSNYWRFIPEEDGKSCKIDFFVDFEFKNPILQKTINIFFHEAVKRMVNAFESRAIALYGAR